MAPIHIACESDSYSRNGEIIKLLLSNNDNKIYATNNQGQSPIDIATDSEIIQLFYE